MKKCYFVAGIIGVILVGGFIFVTQGNPERASFASENTPSFVSVSLSIADVLSKNDATVPESTTALELLRKVSKEKSFMLTTKEYAGMGTLVEGIGPHTNGTDGKYWHYYVNGVLAPVGADAYVLKGSDAIEWRFHEPDESL